MIGLTGYSEANYNSMEGYKEDRQAVPTDVVINLSGEVVRDETFRVTVEMGVEDGGTAKTLNLHVVNVLWDYANNTDGRYNHTVRDGWNLGNFDLVPGEFITYVHDVPLDTASWNDQDAIRIAAFLQEPSGNKEVHQAEMIVPLCFGNVNNDMNVDIDDLFEVLSHWGETSGPADVNDDGAVDINDVFDVLSNWGWCGGPSSE